MISFNTVSIKVKDKQMLKCFVIENVANIVFSGNVLIQEADIINDPGKSNCAVTHNN